MNIRLYGTGGFMEIGEIKGVPTTSGRVAGMRNVSVPTVVHNQWRNQPLENLVTVCHNFPLLYEQI